MEKYIYKLIRASALASEIGGKVYRRGMRPRDAKTEDIIVGLVSGSLGQRQEGEVEIDIFVPQIYVGYHSNRVDDLARIQWICDMLQEIILEHGNPQIDLSINTEPSIESLSQRKQTLVKVKIEYTFINS